jgi:phosphoribosylformylglycinamidine synthase subunit PurQ / glutaminase
MAERDEEALRPSASEEDPFSTMTDVHGGTRSHLKVALLTIEGTNCDTELFVAFQALGVNPEIVHLKQFEGRDIEPEQRRRLLDYQMLLIPGGFSAGDYVRAGAIMAARVHAAIGKDLQEFVRAGRIVGGLCNGFQVLTELGLLPGRPGGRIGAPEAALMSNDSGRYECRPTFVRWEGGRFPPLRDHPLGERFLFPSGHAEGKLVVAGAQRRLQELEDDGQILFRWVAPDGSPAVYPWNPNGSDGNVAGLTNPEGNVFGLMPHPERNFFRTQRPSWTQERDADGFSDGHAFFDAIVRYVERHA